MPGTSTDTNLRGVKILFDEASHVYSSTINGNEIKYISGTTFIHKFFPEFDADKIAPFSAKKEGCTVEEIKQKWKQIGIEAVTFGTRVHEVCEDTLLNRPIRNKPTTEKEKIVFKNAESISKIIREKFRILGVEKIVFDENLKIAGTIDLFAQNNLGTYLILDHKTNKSIDFENKYGEKALPPIEELDNCNFNTYTLQLNLYEFILRYSGYVPKNAKFKRAIIHHTTEQSKIIELPDYQEHIKNMVIYHLANNK